MTADQAEAAGIPVFVWCMACATPSRKLNLLAIRQRKLGDQPIADLAKAGRFRCTHCSKRAMAIMPTLEVLITDKRRLRLSCDHCGKDQALTAAQAVERFGLSTPFDQLRRSLYCSRSCGVRAALMLPTETLQRGARPFISGLT